MKAYRIFNTETNMYEPYGTNMYATSKGAKLSALASYKRESWSHKTGSWKGKFKDQDKYRVHEFDLTGLKGVIV